MITKEQALEALQNVALYLPDDGSEDDHIAQDCIRDLCQYIEQSQPVPEGWCVDLEPTGHIVMRSPDGGFAVINPPEHEAARLAVVSQFLATMLEAAPKPGVDSQEDE